MRIGILFSSSEIQTVTLSCSLKTLPDCTNGLKIIVAIVPNLVLIISLAFNNGFYESLDIIKAIALYGIGKKDHAKRILARIDEANLSFLTRKYFIIQKKIIELALCTHSTSKKFSTLKKEITDLIQATGFIFFKQILKRFSL